MTFAERTLEITMKRSISLVAAIFLLGVSGCGSDSHEAYIKDLIDTLDDARKILQGITDAKKAEELAPRLKDAGERLRSLHGKTQSLKEPLDQKEKGRLAEEYKDKLQKGVADLANEWDRVMKVKGAKEALEKKGALDNWTYKR
jgi:membrane protein involved in colicin uptake